MEEEIEKEIEDTKVLRGYRGGYRHQRVTPDRTWRRQSWYDINWAELGRQVDKGYRKFWAKRGRQL